MSPRTPRSTAEPIAPSGGARAERRIRRAAALPMPDGVSMSPLAPADPLGAANDESTLRSLSSVLAASRTAESEPEADPAAWRPRGTDEAGQTAESTGAEGVAAPPQRHSGRWLTSKVTELPFLVAAAVAGAVVAATPFLASNAKDHTTTYEGLGKADPVAVEGGGAADRHPDAYPGQLPVQGSVTGGATTSADNLLDPDAGSWHGSGGAAAAGDTQTAADSPLVPGVLAADASGSGSGSGAGADSGAQAPDAYTPEQTVAAAASQDTPAKEAAAASRPVATTARATGATGAETPVKATPVKATAVTAAKPSGATTAVSSDAVADPVAARVGATASTGADTAATTKPTASGSALTPVDDAGTATGGTNDTPGTSGTSGASNALSEDRTQAVSSSSTEDTPTDTSATASDTTSDTSADTSSDTPAGQSVAADPAPAWSTEVFASTFTLRSGESVHSDRMRITMRADGDLVISDENGTVRWSSHTSGQSNYATFKADGELVVRSAYQQTLWSSRTGGHTAAKLVIQNDGNVTILSADDQTLWAAGTQH
ncbi:hypothetical protein [Streptomyces sp. NPDC005799]|uniref:hypothetical protein n=1 Tax=Streptomyces sp. NPDC005799 TaxID=3154678 RepID=UPI0033E67597